MIRYRIIVEQLVADEKLTETDRRSKPAGRYLYAAKSEAKALANFRREFTFCAPEDFNVRIEVFEEASHNEYI
jgi:hypothetical protein